MRVPIRELIIRALTARVSAVRGMETYDAQELPLTILVEGDDTAGESDYDLTRVVMSVTIARAATQSGAKGDDWYSAANELLAGLIEESFASDPTFAGLADGMDYTGGSVARLDDGSRGVMVQIFLEIRYAFLHGNPYSREVT